MEASAIRARIAKRTVRDQVELSCAKLRSSIDFTGSPSVTPFFGVPITNIDDLDPTKNSAPGFKDVNFGKTIKPPPPPSVHFNIGVIGGGMAGLYASLILEYLGLTHEVIEASQRPGGRVWSHHFTKKDGDYYEVGAMLFPHIPIMSRTFRLLELLNIEMDETPHPKQGCLIPHHLTGPNNPMYFNNILKVAGSELGDWDPFRVSVKNGGLVPDRFVRMGYKEILKEVFDEWKKRLVSNFEKTWAELMELDQKATSLRAYMIAKFEDKNCDRGTRHFDESFVTWLLLSLEFNYPAPAPPTYNTQPIMDSSKDSDIVWWCLNGGTDITAKTIVSTLTKKPLYNGRVTGISWNPGQLHGDPMTVKILQKDPQNPNTAPRLIEKRYSHVINTTTAPCLQIMDLRNAGLSFSQREAIRMLGYDNAVKVGIKFRYRWWAEDRGITKGGVGTTDRPTRVIIYPSHALDTPKGESGVLIACYNWGQDASRLGGLSQGSDETKQDAIFDAIVADLAIMHDYPEAKLRSLVMSYHVHDWNRDPLVNGHISFLGPGQFSSFFGQIQRLAARGRLFFAGETTSIYHGWIVAALNSVYRAIHQMLLCELIRVLWDKDKMAYILSLIVHLTENWGSSKFEPETEYDTDPKGTAGWQVFLGMYEKNV
ncbi:MAG: hypothetical protein M1834_004888 [Cirrosporium novae-zelandiae]|nr:MAG: hypothetical protein M1834_004888 [Cirrosporium novae-zelandiae]